MRALSPSTVLSTCLLVAACGGESKSPPKTPVPPVSEIAEATAEQPVDLSPVSAPRDLVLTGRLSRPVHVADTVGRWAGVPLGVRALLRSVLPKEQQSVEELVAWDAPIQLAGVVSQTQAAPDFDVVVSVGLTDLERAVTTLREMGASVDRLRPGVFQVSPPDEEPLCAVAAARGQAPARLVCGPKFDAVERLLPYATRGLPEAPAGKSELEIDFNPEPIQRLYGQQISSLSLLSGLAIRQASLDHPGFDRALADAVYALAGELQTLALDVDRVRIEGKLDEPSSTIDLAFAFKLKSAKSWVGETLKDASARSASAPELFWQLPEDATGASYVYPIDPARVRPLLRTAADLADGFLDHERVSRASRDRVRNVLLDFGASMVPYVQAEGNEAPLSGQDRSLSEAFSQFLGWQLIVAEGSPAPHLKVLKDLHAVVNDRELRKLIGQRLDLEPKLMPTSQMKALAGKGLPPGGNVFIVTLPAALLEKYPELVESFGAKGKGETIKAVIAIVGDGKRTIMAIAADEKTAAARIAAFKAGKGPTLNERKELAALRSTKAISAGFLSLSALSREFLSAPEYRARAGRILDVLPHHGKAPILSAIKADASNGVTLRVEMRVPQAVLQDVAALVPALMTF
jgi:hypothetical protein